MERAGLESAHVHSDERSTPSLTNKRSRCFNFVVRSLSVGTWNYRVFRQKLPDGSVELSIREAFYDCDGEHDGQACTEDHVPHSWSASAEDASAENEEELNFIVQGMLKALERPALTLSEDGDSVR
jgi:hypothetical protein